MIILFLGAVIGAAVIGGISFVGLYRFAKTPQCTEMVRKFLNQQAGEFELGTEDELTTRFIQFTNRERRANEERFGSIEAQNEKNNSVNRLNHEFFRVQNGTLTKRISNLEEKCDRNENDLTAAFEAIHRQMEALKIAQNCIKSINANVEEEKKNDFKLALKYFFGTPPKSV